jgi:hypothetical protein
LTYDEKDSNFKNQQANIIYNIAVQYKKWRYQDHPFDVGFTTSTAI